MIEDFLRPLICPRFLSDEKYRKGHIAILAVSEGTSVMGLHTPEMKSAAKEIVKKGKADEVLDGLRDQMASRGRQSLFHEERMVWGLILDYMKVPLEERLRRIGEFLPSIDNWAICDNFCCNSRWAKKEDKERLWEWILSLLHTKRTDPCYEFTVRTGLILSMCHFLEKDTIQRTLSTLESLPFKEGEPYYIRMGAAWLMATSLAKDVETTRAFASSSTLPSDILKLYARKARESRITKEVSPF
ncbi:MAG: DNA alkylation repair protein [Bacteroidales bacterium]|nr:DNA alkylation repair protein [Bacteroidales bacterium]